MVMADQLHNGARHLTLRRGDEPSFLVPAWMIEPEAASAKIVDVPCLSIASLVGLRAFLDSRLAFTLGGRIPEGGADGEEVDGRTAGFVRGGAPKRSAGAGGAGESRGATPGAANRGDPDGPEGIRR